MIYLTEIMAVDASDGQLKRFAGPDIEAPTKEQAQAYCLANGLGYCRVIGVLLGRVVVDKDVDFKMN